LQHPLEGIKASSLEVQVQVDKFHILATATSAVSSGDTSRTVPLAASLLDSRVEECTAAPRPAEVVSSCMGVEPHLFEANILHTMRSGVELPVCQGEPATSRRENDHSYREFAANSCEKVLRRAQIRPPGSATVSRSQPSRPRGSTPTEPRAPQTCSALTHR